MVEIHREDENMSNSVLAALFNGKIIPWERKCNRSSERRELEQKIESEKQYFLEKMPLDDRERFEQLFNIFCEATFDEEVDIYAHGFTLGSLMMVEVMEKKEDIINE